MYFCFTQSQRLSIKFNVVVVYVPCLLSLNESLECDHWCCLFLTILPDFFLSFELSTLVNKRVNKPQRCYDHRNPKFMIINELCKRQEWNVIL